MQGERRFVAWGKKALRAVLVMGTALAALGCSGGEREAGRADALTIVANGLSIEREPSALRGRFEMGDSVVTFESMNVGEGAASLRLVVNEKILEIEMDTRAGHMATDGHDVVLESRDKLALKGFATTLGGYLVGNGGARHELFAPVNAEYWSEAPDGYVHTAETRLVRVRTLPAEDGAGRVRSLSNGDDGVTCITKNTTRTAYYDQGTSGTVYSASVVVNSNWGTNACGGGDYNCMGRCGGGCGWGAPSSYTLDCLDHDVCSHNLCGSGGGADANCGDEYNMAQDDWAQGVLRGCYG